MSNYSAIYSTVEEIGGLCLSLGGAVNAVVSANDHLVDHKVLLYGFIPNRKFQYFSMLLSLPLCSIYQNTSKSGERNQYSKCNLIIYDTEVKALATPQLISYRWTYTELQTEMMSLCFYSGAPWNL